MILNEKYRFYRVKCFGDYNKCFLFEKQGLYGYQESDRKAQLQNNCVRN